MMNRIRTAIERKRAAEPDPADYAWRPGPGRKLTSGRRAE